MICLVFWKTSWRVEAAGLMYRCCSNQNPSSRAAKPWSHTRLFLQNKYALKRLFNSLHWNLNSLLLDAEQLSLKAEDFKLWAAAPAGEHWRNRWGQSKYKHEIYGFHSWTNAFSKGWHSGSVVIIAPHSKKVLGLISSRGRAFLSGVCVFFLCPRWFPPHALDSLVIKIMHVRVNTPGSTLDQDTDEDLELVPGRCIVTVNCSSGTGHMWRQNFIINTLNFINFSLMAEKFSVFSSKLQKKKSWPSCFTKEFNMRPTQNFCLSCCCSSIGPAGTARTSRHVRSVYFSPVLFVNCVQTNLLYET